MPDVACHSVSQGDVAIYNTEGMEMLRARFNALSDDEKRIGAMLGLGVAVPVDEAELRLANDFYRIGNDLIDLSGYARRMVREGRAIITVRAGRLGTDGVGVCSPLVYALHGYM